MLRCGGKELSVRAYLEVTRLTVVESSIRGARRFPSLDTDLRCFEDSAMLIVISSADFHQFGIQIEDAIAFSHEYKNDLEFLRNFPGVDWMFIDFGATLESAYDGRMRFPSELVRSWGNLGVDICLSLYP